MPELPEVETIVRGLQPICGAAIRGVRVLDRKLSLPSRALIGERIASVSRRGKYIAIELGSGRSLVVHLRMSGRLLRSCDQDEARHTRLVLNLDRGEVLFVDPRRLGTVECVEGAFPHAVGVDPLDAAFTRERLSRILATSRSPVKVLLMDQRRIAGLGNIYAAEALWRAEIDPRRRARDLAPREARVLHRAIREVLDQAIARAGTSIGSGVSDFRPAAGRRGEYQEALCVYGREGEACPRCAGTLERVKQGGRSTYFCPGCQR